LCGLRDVVYSEGTALLEKSVALITSGRNKLTIHGWKKAFVEKICKLIVILPTICGQIARLLNHTTLYGHQFFLLCMLVRTFRVF
jgi:hypothetical protein